MTARWNLVGTLVTVVSKRGGKADATVVGGRGIFQFCLFVDFVVLVENDMNPHHKLSTGDGDWHRKLGREDPKSDGKICKLVREINIIG